jgi:peptidoglycan hydrolase-like protein with peptidoglycan-binding domain
MSLRRSASLVLLGAVAFLAFGLEGSVQRSKARPKAPKPAAAAPVHRAPVRPAQMAIIPDPIPLPSPERVRKPRKVFPLNIGSRGREVKVLQRALARTTYDPGPIDGNYGYGTQHAVYAFEKVHALPLDGKVVRKQLRRILKAKPPVAPKYSVPTFVDIDIGTQVLREVVNGRVVKTLPVSTGNGAYYQSQSGIAIAHTPRGTFQIYSKVVDWKVGYLGSMYYPSYFNGGYAIHGSISVPPYPASHGCVRIPMHSTVGFFERNPVGTPIYVHD